MRRWNVLLVLALIALGVGLLLVGRRPVEYAAFEVPLFAAPLESVAGAEEIRSAHCAWAQTMPAGQNVSVHLTLDSTVNEGKNLNESPLTIDGLYSRSSSQLEARLEIRDVAVYPPGSIVQNLVPLQPASFYWRLNASRAGEYEGTLWIYTNYIHPDGQQIHQLVFARPITINAVDVLGFLPHQVQTAGWVGMALALIAAFPLLRSQLIRYWEQVRGENT